MLTRQPRVTPDLRRRVGSTQCAAALLVEAALVILGVSMLWSRRHRLWPLARRRA